MKRLPRVLLNTLKASGFSSFSIRVYEEIYNISWGQTRSYKWVSQRLKKRKSQQAIGQALKRNPFPLTIPCHRVIKQDGSIGGFSGGRSLKKRLLELEKAAIIK